MNACDDVAFLFLDLQDDLLPLACMQPGARVRVVAGALARFAAGPSMPALASIVALGSPDPAPIPELTGHGLPVVRRAGPRIFSHQATIDTVRGLDRGTLLLCGLLTEVVVLHAALDAVRLGFKVQIVIDAYSGISSRTEAAAVRQMERAGVEVVSGLGLLTGMIHDFGSELGGEVVAALQVLLA